MPASAASGCCYSSSFTACFTWGLSAAFRYLAEQESDWDISALKRKSKQIYRQMVSRTPEIGSMLKNPLRVCMTGGMLWLSIFEAAERRMSEKRFEGMYGRCQHENAAGAEILP